MRALPTFRRGPSHSGARDHRSRWPGPLLGLALLALAACAPAPVPPERLSETLRPHDLLLLPEGAGPFPAVVLMHSCAGNVGHVDAWAARLRERGYAALVVNSMRARGIDSLPGALGVCRGAVLLGDERAADLYVSLDHLRRDPRIDSARLAVIGFSHGGWAALNALGLPLDPALERVAPGGLDGLRAVAAVYPYCGEKARGRIRFWPGEAAVLIVSGGRDTTVGFRECQGLARAAAALGKPVRGHLYADAAHAFDIPPELIWGFARRYRPDLGRDLEARLLAFLADRLRPAAQSAGGS